MFFIRPDFILPIFFLIVGSGSNFATSILLLTIIFLIHPSKDFGSLEICLSFSMSFMKTYWLFLWSLWSLLIDTTFMIWEERIKSQSSLILHVVFPLNPSSVHFVFKYLIRSRKHGLEFGVRVIFWQKWWWWSGNSGSFSKFSFWFERNQFIFKLIWFFMLLFTYLIQLYVLLTRAINKGCKYLIRLIKHGLDCVVYGWRHI